MGKTELRLQLVPIELASAYVAVGYNGFSDLKVVQ